MSKVIVEIHKEKIDVRSGISGKTGKPFSMNEQTGWVRFPDCPYPTEFVFTPVLDPASGDVCPIKRGIYTLELSEIVQVGRFKGIELDDRKVASSLVYHSALKEKASA